MCFRMPYHRKNSKTGQGTDRKGHLRAEREGVKVQLAQHPIPQLDSEEVDQGDGHAQGWDDTSRQIQLVDDDGEHSSIKGPKNNRPHLRINHSPAMAHRAFSLIWI